MVANHEGEPFQIPGMPRVSFFLLKRLMYVRLKGGPGALRGWVCNAFFIKYKTDFSRDSILCHCLIPSSSCIIVSEVFIIVFSTLCSLFQLVWLQFSTTSVVAI